MKKVTFLLALVFTCSSIFAQVKEAKRFMSQGQNNALVVSLQKSDIGDVEKEWMRIVKNFGAKTKKISKTGEFFTDNADIPALSRNTVDIYALIEGRGPDAELVVWFDLGGAFLSSEMHPTRFPYAEKLLGDMSLKVSEAAMEEELSRQESQLTKLAEKLKELRENRNEVTDEIMKYVDKITEARNKIEGIEAQFKSTQQTYSAQEQAVENAKNRLRSYRDVANK